MTDTATLRMPGRHFERLMDLALAKIGEDDSAANLDAAEAVSFVKLKRYGSGRQAFVRLTHSQAATIAGWLDMPYAGRETRHVRDLLRGFAEKGLDSPHPLPPPQPNPTTKERKKEEAT